MIKKLKELEKAASPLEPKAKERKEIRKKIIDYTETFLKDIYKSKAYQTNSDNGLSLLESPISEKKININKALELLRTNVDATGINPASGGHLGYIPGGGIYFSSLGDYMAAITNRYAGIFFANPGAVRMENMLIEWLAKIVGYPINTAGNLSSGGSMANLIAIVTARDAHKFQSKDISKTVIYLSEHAHHCLDKAFRIAGLNECIKRNIPLDEKFRIIPEEMEKAIKKDKKNGLRPWMIIASAGTTDVGAIDPLDTLGDIAKRNKLWFHIDAAYGGFFILTKEGKKKLKGIEKSDSIVMDPHKGLFIPYGLGVVLIKNKKQMMKSHFYQANYMQDTFSNEEEVSPADLSPELTKHFRGLRLWLPLKLIGLSPFQAALEEKLLLARYFYQKIKKINGFEVGPEPELSVVTYRYIPKKEDPNKFNEELVKLIHSDGRVFISSTMINGKFTLRMAILSFRTHLKTIDLALKIINEKVKMLEDSNTNNS